MNEMTLTRFFTRIINGGTWAFTGAWICARFDYGQWVPWWMFLVYLLAPFNWWILKRRREAEQKKQLTLPFLLALLFPSAAQAWILQAILAGILLGLLIAGGCVVADANKKAEEIRKRQEQQQKDLEQGAEQASISRVTRFVVVLADSAPGPQVQAAAPIIEVGRETAENLLRKMDVVAKTNQSTVVFSK